MTEAEEDKLLALKDFMLKSSKAKATMGEQSHLGEAGLSGVIDLATLGITGRQVDLVKARPEAEDKRGGWREGSPDLTGTSQTKRSKSWSTRTSSVCWTPRFCLWFRFFLVKGPFNLLPDLLI